MDPAMNCPLKTHEGRVTSAVRGAGDSHHTSLAASGFRTSDFGLRISRSARAAFSLLEVMIACGIFFMAVFAILAMVSGVLRNARSLRRIPLDAGMVAAQISLTNKLYEGSQSGDFGNMYQDYSWEADTYEPPGATNGLFQVDIIVRCRGIQKPVDVMSIWLYRPESPPPR
jgi:Tfp pilus assembly protein PilV